MPDQTSDNNQPKKPQNPFQAASPNGQNGQNGGAPKPQNPFQAASPNGQNGQNGQKVSNNGKSQNPFEKSSKVKAEEQVKTKESPKVAPINPFAESGSAKVQNPFTPSVSREKPKKDEKVYEGEIIEKKPELKKPEANIPKETVKVVERVERVEREPGPIKSPPVAEVKEEPDVEVLGEFKHQMMDILDQAGLTKSTLIKTVVVIVVGIILVMGYFYGWYGMVTNIFSKSGQTQVQRTQQTQTQQPVVATPVSQTGYNANSPFGLVTAYIFGLEYNKPVQAINAVPMGTWGNDAGVRAAQVFGMIADEKQVKFIEYVALLRKLQNIYDTDIYALLDMAADRRVALQLHMNDLSSLIDQATNASNDLDRDLLAFQQIYDPYIQAKNLYESNFYNSLNAFYGETAYVNLGLFIKSSQDAVAIKAFYSAEKSLKDLFTAYLAALKPRYNDISLNTEALIKGVHVFYVPKSDIKAIIQLGQ